MRYAFVSPLATLQRGAGSWGAWSRAAGQRVGGADERPGVTPAAVLGGGGLCSAGRDRPAWGWGCSSGPGSWLAGFPSAALVPSLPPRPCCHTDLAATPTLLSHRGFLFCLSLGACGVFPARSQAVEASSLFLQLPPALSTSGRLHTPFPEPARVQGRCQHCGPALPFAPSSCPLRRLASALGGRRPGPCPLPLVLLGLRRRF